MSDKLPPRLALMLSSVVRRGAPLAFALIPLAWLQPARQDPAPTPAMLALGDSVFHGKVGAALCYVCHGPAGKGVTGLGPNLTDTEWLNGDGSLAFIEKTVETGVPKPKKAPAPMPPGVAVSWMNRRSRRWRRTSTR